MLPSLLVKWDTSPRGLTASLEFSLLSRKTPGQGKILTSNKICMLSPVNWSFVSSVPRPSPAAWEAGAEVPLPSSGRRAAHWTDVPAGWEAGCWRRGRRGARGRGPIAARALVGSGRKPKFYPTGDINYICSFTNRHEITVYMFICNLFFLIIKTHAGSIVFSMCKRPYPGHLAWVLLSHCLCWERELDSVSTSIIQIRAETLPLLSTCICGRSFPGTSKNLWTGMFLTRKVLFCCWPASCPLWSPGRG